MSGKAPLLYQLELLDMALAPDLLPGDRVTLDGTLVAMAGDLVLLGNQRGQFMIRQLRETLPGQWHGVSPNPAYAPLDLSAHELAPHAVVVEEIKRGRRSRKA